jgi:hypothetical protein
MSEAYFVSGVQQPAGTPLEALLQAICAQAEVKPNRVDEIHLFGDAVAALFQRRLDTPFGAVIYWPLIPFLPVSVLFSACRALETGEISTCIVAENSAALSCAILLANPNGIGRLNLTPQVHLDGRFTYPAGIPNLDAAADKVFKSIPQDDTIPADNVVDLRIPPKADPLPWVAIHSPSKPASLNWPSTRSIHHSSVLPGLIMLVKAMKTSKTDPGILISCTPNEPSAALLVLPL